MLPLATLFQIAGLAINLLGVVVPEADKIAARGQQCCCKTIVINHYTILRQGDRANDRRAHALRGSNSGRA